MPYLDVAQVETALANAAAGPNSPFTQLITLPNATWQNRTCRALKIANGSGPGRIGVYFIGGLHAREWGSPDILIYFAQRLTKAYRTNAGITLGGMSFNPSQIQKIVNNLDIFIFPQVNPDGRNYSMTTDVWWRKNRRPAPSSSPTCLGVDINRNFDFLWNYPSFFDPAAPVTNSTSACSEVYIGPGAVSEPETQNVVWMFDNHSNIHFFVDVHSYGELILYPWSDDQNQSTNPNMNFRNPAYDGLRGIKDDVAYKEHIDSSDRSLGTDLAKQIRDGIQAVRGRSYTVEQSMDLYPSAGTSIDYAFSRNLTDRTKGRVFPFTIEWGSAANPTPFHPPYGEMQCIIEEVTAGLLAFCLRILETHADVYIKDNANDTGAVPYSGRFWDNSDVVIRQNDDDVFAHEEAQQGQTNYIYVKVTNLGPSSAQEVKVAVRAVRYPNTELVYPYDWVTTDATHVTPAAIIDTFNSIPPGQTRIAKFSLSSAEVDTLWGWQSGGWHPCLAAEVKGCNDYGSPVGRHVYENNNLAQRNVSIVPVHLQSHLLSVNLPFLVGHVQNMDDTIELIIDRGELPQEVELLLDPSDQKPIFEGVELTESDPEYKAKFLDRTRIGINLFGRDGILTLPAGALFEWGTDAEKSVLLHNGADLVRRNGRSLLTLRQQQVLLRLRRQPGCLHQMTLMFQVPKTAKPGACYRVHVAQRDQTEKIIGGISLEVPVFE